MNLTFWSYLIAAMAFGGTAWLVPHAFPLRRAPRIRLCLVIFMGWALIVAAHAGGEFTATTFLGRLLPLVDVLRYGAVLLLLGALGNASAAGWLRRLNLGLWSVALLLTLAGMVSPKAVGMLSLAGLLLSLTGLVNIEQLLRNAPPASSRGINFCVVGIGGQLAYDMFLYSQAQLLGAIDEQAWALRGFVFAALLPIASIGFKRLAKEQPTLFVSRQFVFYSTAFLSVGVYLLFMALGGYYVREHGGNWGESLRLIFFVGAGVVLALLVLSHSLRRRWRVFVAKHFYRNKYDYRVEWLRFIDTLSRPDSSDARVTSIRAIAQILESPGGALYLRDEGTGRFELSATWVLNHVPVRSLPAMAPEQDLVRFLADRQWVVDLQEYGKDPGLYRNIELPSWLLDTRDNWRIVNPLLELDQLIGFLVLMAPPEPFQMTFEDRDLLRTVGRHVATLLAQQAADRQLAEGRQFDAFNRFAAFVMHDLKNSVAQLQLLASNAARHRNNPEFIDDAFATIENTASRIARLIGQLQSRDVSAGNRVVDVDQVLGAAIERCARQQPTPEREGSGGTSSVRADPERLIAIFEHLLRNAQDAAGTIGRVRVYAKQVASQVEIAIADTGAGMDAQFIRDRLFRPFDSTKGSRGMGIGAYQAREYVREIKGTIEVQSTPGSGTRFIVRLPLCQNINSES